MSRRRAARVGRTKARRLRQEGLRSERLRHRAAIGLPAGAFAVAGLGAAATSAQAVDFTVINTNSTGAGSLNKAIENSNLTPNVADRILFASGVTGTIDQTTPLELIQSPVEIKGPGKTQLKIDGQGARMFKMYSPLTISGLTLANGKAAQGGAIDDTPGYALTVSGVAFTGNTSTNTTGIGGGAIFSYNADLNVSDSSFTGNYSDRPGGAIMSAYSDTTITNSTFSGNSAKHNGGAFYGYANQVTVTGSTFTDNHSNNFAGGALFVDYPTAVSVTGSTFTGNTSANGGGAIFSYQTQTPANPSSLNIDSSTFDSNEAYSDKGGAVAVFGGISSKVFNTTVTGNSAPLGGAVYSQYPVLTVESSTITGNKTTSLSPNDQFRGAGLSQVYGPLTLRNSIVTGNTPLDVSTFPVASGPTPPAAGSIQSSFSLIGKPGSAVINETVPGSDLPASTDPLLSPLAANGGLTKTMLPKPASPVIDKGSSALATDQRGLVRPVEFASVPNSTAAGANGADLGAVEVQTAEGPTGPTGPTGPSGPTGPTGVAPTLRIGKLSFNRKEGTATLAVTGNEAGKILLVGTRLVKSSSKTLKAKGTVKLTIKAKGKAAKQLKKKGKARVKATVRFSAGGASVSKGSSVTLKKKVRK